MKDKIEEILSKYDHTEGLDTEGNKYSTAWMWKLTPLVKELSTLIQEERKDAVEGFVKYIFSRPSNEWMFPDLMLEEYLESEGKK